MMGATRHYPTPANELLAALGAHISQVEERFVATHGWTPRRQTRVWESGPKIGQYQGALAPILLAEATRGVCGCKKIGVGSPLPFKSTCSGDGSPGLGSPDPLPADGVMVAPGPYPAPRPTTLPRYRLTPFF